MVVERAVRDFARRGDDCVRQFLVEQAQPVEAILDARVARDAGAALVAVAQATDAGRDPRTLGEVLIGALRNAFLSVMGAPDRHQPAVDAERSAALGAQLGPAGLTRALDVLGEALVELGKKPDPRTALLQLLAIIRHDTRRRLHGIQAPTQIIKPASDILVRPFHSDVLASGIPGARLVTIDDTGHGITFQAKEQINERIREHVAAHEPHVPSEPVAEAS